MRGPQLPIRSSRAENSLPQSERELRRPEGSGMLIAMLARPTRRALGSGELIPQNEKELRRSAGSGMLIDNPLMRGAVLALPITTSGERRTHSSE